MKISIFMIRHPKKSNWKIDISGRNNGLLKYELSFVCTNFRLLFNRQRLLYTLFKQNRHHLGWFDWSGCEIFYSPLHVTKSSVFKSFRIVDNNSAEISSKCENKLLWLFCFCCLWAAFAIKTHLFIKQFAF